jgi:hypothetical protein
MNTAKYLFKATVTVRQQRVASQKSEQALQEFAEQNFLSVLNPLLISSKQSFSYYHPDEEAEMKAIDYVELHISLQRPCKRFRSVVALSQLVLALSNLFDGTAGTEVQCSLDDPLLLPLGDKND